MPVDSKVKINVYNSLGQLVETLVNEELGSGYHEVNFNASRLASGVYLYQLQAGEYISSRKMVHLSNNNFYWLSQKNGSCHCEGGTTEAIFLK